MFTAKRRLETIEDQLQTARDRMADLERANRRIEGEWDDMRARLQKSYQRVERANQRAVKRDDDAQEEPESSPEPSPQERILERRRMAANGLPQNEPDIEPGGSLPAQASGRRNLGWPS